MKKSSFVSLVAVFASLNVVCDAIIVPQFSLGVWYGLVFLIEPITGIVLGPYVGFLSTFIGVIVGHTITPRGAEEFLFTLGAPIGAMVSGFLFRGKWKPVFLCYTVLLAAYFITPIAWQLPMWGMWDVYFAYLILFLTILMTGRKSVWDNKSNRNLYVLALSAFIGLEADILFRIFVFIPCQTYRLFYGLPVEILQGIWVAGALITPIKVAISALITTVLGLHLTKILPLGGQKNRL